MLPSLRRIAISTGVAKAVTLAFSNDKPNDNGLNNLFNGNRIMPHDDTFYIDDFR